MSTEYLNKVRVYLQQEMPDYKEDVEIENNKLIFKMPNGQSFQSYYDAVFNAVTVAIARVRSRKYDLDFTVRSANQERDFKIYKDVPA